MSTLIINDKILYIKKIKDYDIKYSYYNTMSVLPREYIRMLTTMTVQEIEVRLTETMIFLIEDVNSKIIIGSGILSLLNYSSNIAKVGYIEEIIIHKEYESAELRNEIINYLTNYCMSKEKCIKCIQKE